MEACKQRAIAHILGTLDDKIELNRRMNETLEAMARALFKSWFVDFDPVRAKMALNHSPPEGESQKPSRQATADVVGGHHSPLEGESQPAEPSGDSGYGGGHHSPLEGESQPAEPSGDSGCGGGTNRRSPQASRWGEIKRSYPEKTPEPGEIPAPKPNRRRRSCSGTICATNNWMATNSAANNPLARTSSISPAYPKNCSSNWTAANMLNVKATTSRETDFCKARGTGFFASGTTKFSKTVSTCWSRYTRR